MASRTPTVVIRAAPLTGELDGYYYSQPLPAAGPPRLDPFLRLHHHGLMDLPAGTGMPFGPHPHRGFCTLTVILAGSVVHQDSHGFKSEVEAGGAPGTAGAQWMTADRGLIHNESTPQEFLDTGGPLELWISLPARLKMTPAHYEALPAGRIVNLHEGAGVRIQLFTGHWHLHPGSYQAPTATVSALVRVPAGATYALPAPATQTVLVYVLRGQPTIAGEAVELRDLVAFNATEADFGGAPDDTTAPTAGSGEALLFYCAGEPLREPVVQHGPFAMTTEKKILEAMRDYQMGKMGVFVNE